VGGSQVVSTQQAPVVLVPLYILPHASAQVLPVQVVAAQALVGMHGAPPVSQTQIPLTNFRYSSSAQTISVTVVCGTHDQLPLLDSKISLSAQAGIKGGSVKAVHTQTPATDSKISLSAQVGTKGGSVKGVHTQSPSTASKISLLAQVGTVTGVE